MVVEYCLVLVGSPGVGISALILRLTQNMFVENYDPTIEDVYRPQVSVDDEACLLCMVEIRRLVDSTIRDSDLRNGHGYVLVYDITSRPSLDEVVALRKQITRVTEDSNIPMMVVGSKCDLEEERQVSTSEGEELAKSFECLFFETSALRGDNVVDAFYDLIRGVRKHMEGGNSSSKKGQACCVVL
eukprot:TRINITY_DN5773_c0_g1_i1.p1 TRINITY_DN5773_c0_g1~~TRINITY_DN5773_c0_g1_i1.p1  ORF type:complete len:186 (+),score=56.19 TRINITY_DN5773_c0_g1_i1:90-647(+)